MIEGKTVRNSWPGVGAPWLPSCMPASATSVRDGDQLVECARGRPGFDRALGELGALQNIVGLAGDHSRGCGVEHGDVSQRCLLAGEELDDGVSIGVLIGWSD